MGHHKSTKKLRQLLASNMRQRRKELGFSQEKLAELAELHPTYISSIENKRRNLSLDSLERIARALRLPLAKLLKE